MVVVALAVLLLPIARPAAPVPRQAGAGARAVEVDAVAVAAVVAVVAVRRPAGRPQVERRPAAGQRRAVQASVVVVARFQPVGAADNRASGTAAFRFRRTAYRTSRAAITRTTCRPAFSQRSSSRRCFRTSSSRTSM